MINYTELTDYLVEVAERNPNLKFVSFDTDIDAMLDPDFQCPAIIISPASSVMLERGLIQYGFQIIYLDKINEEMDNYGDVLETGIQNIMTYLQVINLKYKVIFGNTIDPIINIEGGTMYGQQTQFQIEDQYNIDRFNSVYYDENDLID